MLTIEGCLRVGVGTVLATDSNYKQQIGDSSALHNRADIGQELP